VLNHLPPGDVLIIVPPVTKTEVPSLAAHLLQAYCHRSGIKVRVLYANMIFSTLIGFDLYRTIAEFNSINFIGERLFTRSAFNLPPMGLNIHRLINPDWLPDHHWQTKNEIAGQKMSKNLSPIRRWIFSVDWQQLEQQAKQWTTSIAQKITRMGYRIVGCSNTLGGLVPALALLNRVKQADPNITTVLGGALCEGEMAEGLLSLNLGIDYIFSGESDNTFPSFVQDTLAGKQTVEKIIFGKEVTDLDEIPLPDYREFFQQSERLALRPSFGDSFPVLYETSRGCSWKKCTFCGLTGERKSHHIKSPEKVLEDLEQLLNQYPESPIHMADNLMPVQYFKTLFPKIPGKFPSIRIRYEVNAKLTLNQALMLKQAGITRIQAGIESLSPSLLRRMQKGVTLQENIALLKYCRSLGLDLSWHLLMGIPGDQMEEYEEILQLFPLIHHLQPPEMIPPIKICRFSMYHRKPESFGISELRPAALYEDVLPSHTNLEKIAYFFAGDFKAQSYEHPEIISALREEFRAWVSAWKPYDGNLLNPQLPKLNLERRSTDGFVLHDTRGLPGRPKTIALDNEQADILLVTRPWKNSPDLQWAVDAKLGVVRESWFIPLPTANPVLLLEFEQHQG
jgi:ribosomal peptide maturation radical SAM protein 1